MKFHLFICGLIYSFSSFFAQKMSYIGKEDQASFFDYSNPYSLVSLIDKNREIIPSLAEENHFDGVYHLPSLLELGIDTSLLSRFTTWSLLYIARPDLNDSVLLLKSCDRTFEHYLDSIKHLPNMEILAQIDPSKFQRIWDNTKEMCALKTPYDFYFDTKNIVGLIVSETNEEKWFHFISEINGKRIIGLSLRAEQVFKEGNLVFYEKVDSIQASQISHFYEVRERDNYASVDENQVNGFNYCSFGETIFSDCFRSTIGNLSISFMPHYESSNTNFMQFGAIDTIGFNLLTKTQIRGNPILYYDFDYNEMMPFIKKTDSWINFRDSSGLLFYMEMEQYDTTLFHVIFEKTLLEDTMRWEKKTDLFWASHPNTDVYVLLGIKRHKNAYSVFVNQYYFTIPTNRGPKAYMSFGGMCNQGEDFIPIAFPTIESEFGKLFNTLIKLRTKKTSFEKIQKESHLIQSSLNI
jgi:hypothetical protein